MTKPSSRSALRFIPPAIALAAAVVGVACREGDPPPAPVAAATEAPEVAEAGPVIPANTVAPDPTGSASAQASASASGSAAAVGSASASPADAGALAADAGLLPVAIGAVSPDGGVAENQTPEGMVRIGRFFIDKYEAHLIAYGAEGQITSLPHYARPPEDGKYQARSEPDVFPQAYISRVESALACKNAGKRLCTMSEWQRACGGRKGTQYYPYGSHIIKGKCNSQKNHLLSIVHGPDATKWKYEQFNDPELNKTPGFLEKTGSYPECGGDNAVFDMVGNVHEWVSDSVDQALMDKLAEENIERHDQPWRVGNGVFMGGFFSTGEELGPGCRYTTVAHEPAYHDYSTGFRCCATVPVPLPSKTVKPPAKKKKVKK